MVINNFPTFSYITWQGLIIVAEDKTPYVINDGNTNCKYIYWEKSVNPYNLKATNEKLSTGASRILIYINDEGNATQVPQDTIGIQYREGGGVLISKIQGQVNELDGKYYAVKQDLDSLEEMIGSSGTSEDGSLLDRLNKIEKTAEGTSEEISQLKTTYEKNEKSERMRDNILSALISMTTSLSEYQNELSNACEDFEINNEEKLAITEKQNEFVKNANAVYTIHNELIKSIDTETNTETINLLNLAKSNMEMAINNLNTNVNTSLSDGTVVPSEITIMLNMFGTVGVKTNDYKEALSDAIVLGVGGEVVSNTLTINKTATSFSQTMSEIIDEINGETGLKQQVAKNTTNISQTSEDIRLNYMKYDKTTSEITVSDGAIKLDASKVLMTGTLTWDSLDDDAKENLKGEKGQNGTAEYVVLTGDQFIKCASDGTPKKPSVTINTLISGITSIPTIVWKYKQENSGTWVTINSNNNKTYYSLSATSNIWGDKESITIRAIVNDIYYDDLTVVKVRDGIDGSLAEYVEILGEQSFKYAIKRGTTEFTSTPAVIVLEGIAHNLTSTNTRWYYKYPGQTGWTLMSDYNGKYTMSVFPDDPILFKNYDVVQIKFELNTHYDVITLNKIYDGKDSVMAHLSNESHIIPCTSKGEIVSLEGAETNLSIYVGSIDDTKNWTTAVTTEGVIGTLSDNNKKFVVTNLLKDVGYVDFVSKKDDFDAVTRRFTVTKSKNGLDGSVGTDSISYWITNSASSIIKKEDGTFEPSEITINTKCKEGKKEITDFEGIIVVSELINEEWIEKYRSKNKESIYKYIIGDIEEVELIEEPSIEEGEEPPIEEEPIEPPIEEEKEELIAIKVSMYLDDVLIDEEYIPIIKEGISTPIAFLDNDSHIIPCNFNGNPLNYEGAKTTMYVYLGNTDDSDNWTYSIEENGVTGAITNNNRTYEVLKINNDNAYVDIIASKDECESITRRFSLAKAKYGKDGDSAKYIYITGEQVFKYKEDFKGIPTPKTITLKATKYNIMTNGKWQYKNANGTYVDMGITSDTIEITPTMGLFETQNTSTFRFIAEDYYDEITIIKISDGTNGLPGSDGKDGIYILITNESHTIPCDSNGDYTTEDLAKATTEVHVYRGTEEIDATVSVRGQGCTAIYGVANKTVTLTEVTENSAKVTIGIVVDGKTFTKVMTVTKSLRGISASGINIRGVLNSVDDLNGKQGQEGYAYIIDGMLYLWNSESQSWADKGTPITGEQGLPGKDGQDGRTTYLHIKYSNDGGKTFTPQNGDLAEGETIGDYMGQYTDFFKDDSTNPKDYQWIKLKGEDGVSGIVATLSNDNHTIPCAKDGTNGIFIGCSSKISLFMGAEILDDNIDYSYVKSEGIGGTWDGTIGEFKVTEMSTDSGYIDFTATYNGLNYTKRFTITKNKQGDDGITINLSNENHSFVANSEGKIDYPQSTSTTVLVYKGDVRQGFTIDGVSATPSGMTVSYEQNSDTITFSVNKWQEGNSELAKNGTIEIYIKVENEIFTKTFTYTRIDTGKNGVDGLDGYTVYLTNEVHSFYCESNGSILEQQSTITTVKAFRGAEEITPEIGSITSPQGLTVTKNGVTITIKTDGKSLADNGSFNIPITVDDRTFVKVFSWVKSYKGQDGQDGENAKYVVVSGEQVFRYPKGSTTPTPSSIVLSVSKFNTTEKGRWQYKNINGTYIDIGATSDTLTVTPSSGTLASSGSCTFRYTLGNCYDDITIVEVSDGLDGNSGQTFYTWIMYADDANGKNISNSPTNKKYIGLSYNNTSATESTDPTKYKWTLIKGADGVEGAKGEDGLTYYTWIKYSDNANGSNMYDTPKTSTQYIGIATNKLVQAESTVASDYKWSKFKGDTGQAGKDAYTVILTNENHSFISDYNGNITTALTTTSQVIAYKGSTSVTPTLGTIVAPSGMTITKSGTTITFKANTGTSLATSGTVTIPVVVDGITFNKIFTWTKAIKGNPGQNGKNGTDADVPDWVKEWDGKATTINGSSVITPKIFAGTVNNGIPTGVAIGKDVFGTSSSYTVNGIVGYKNGTKTYQLNSDGTLLIGSKSSQHIAWDGSNLELNVKTLKISSSSVATEGYVDQGINNLDIGGRNLLKATDEDKKGTSYALADYYFGNIAPKEGETYTISLKGTLGSDRTSFRAYNSGGSVAIGTLTLKNGIYTWTGKWTITNSSTTATNTFLRIYQFTNSGTTSSTIDWIKLEKGNKVTDYTPAPEDTRDEILSLESNLNSNIDNAIDGAITEIITSTSEMYANKDDYEAWKETVTSDFAQTNENIQMTFTTTLEAVNETTKGLESYKSEVATYIRFGGNGVEIGKSDSPFKTNLSNTKLSFTQSGNEVAYISNNKMYITSAEITNDLKLGRFIWVIGGDGDLTLKWS